MRQTNSQRKYEAVVGLFIIVSLAAFFALTTKFGGLSFGKTGYNIKAVVDSANGIKNKSLVEIAGISIGRVQGLALLNDKAVISMIIKNGIKIPDDSAIAIKTRGAIGEHFIVIIPGKSKKFLISGQSLSRQIKSVDLSSVFRSVKGASDAIKRAADSIDYKGINKTIRSFQNVADNINRAAVSFNRFARNANGVVSDNRKAINQMVTNLNEFGRILKKQAPVILSRLKNFSKNIDNITKENRENIQKTIISINNAANKFAFASNEAGRLIKHINSGQGTIGKLVKSESAYNSLNVALKSVKKTLKKFDQLTIHVEANSKLLTRHSNFKTYVGAKINTSPDLFYKIGVTSERNYKYLSNAPRKRNTKERITAQIGKRYGNIVIRGGITESTFGVGADYYFYNDKLKLSTDAYDFNEYNDIRDSHFHMNIGTNYQFYHYFYLSGGVEDILNTKSRSPYLGFGIRFSDQDLKYLLGSVSPKIK